MMHSLYDLILEAVINSEEAGARNVDISISESDGFLSVIVVDDGNFDKEGSYFSLGFSTKGENRGKGLWYIASVDPKATIRRCNGKTMLQFKVPKEIQGESLEEGLFPVFQRVEKTTFSYTKDGKELFSISDGKDGLLTVGQISGFKKKLRAIKGEYDV